MEDVTKGLVAVVAAAAVAGGLYVGGTALGLFHEQVVQGTQQTRRIATPDYALEQYRWFKGQEAAISQVEAQISSMRGEIEAYRGDFGDIPVAQWPWDAREELARKQATLRGYVSQRNMLGAQYNERHSDVTRAWAEGEAPENLKPFLRNYDHLPTP